MFPFLSSVWSRLAGGVVIATCAMLVSPTPATADPLDENTSLRFAPADASFYAAGMRMRETFDRVAGSKAIEKLQSIPAVQFGRAAALGYWQNPQDPNLAMFKQMLADPANEQLIEVLKDAFSHEFFVYGGADLVGALSLAAEINTATTEGQMEALQAGDFQNMQNYQTRKVLEVLDQNPDRLKVPTIVKGMKLSDTAPALEQLDRLETLFKSTLGGNPMFQDRLAREQIGGGEFLTLRLDGTMVPWPMIMQQNEQVDAELKQQLAEKLTPLELVISVGIMGEYLMFSVGEDNAHLGSLGQDSLLYEREEFAPLRAVADQPVVEVAYVQDELLQQISSVDRQVDQLVTLAKQFAPMVMMANPALQEELIADVEKFAEYIKENASEPGSYSGYTIMMPDGYESYTYDWGEKPQLDASQQLPILKYVGGDPIALFAGRGKSSPEQMDAMQTFFSRAGYYGEQMALQQLDEEQKGAYDQLKADLLPLVKQLGSVTRDKLAPALADGQSAIVVDAKSTSDSWFVMMPPSDGELPMLEVGVVMGVSDAGLLKEAFTDYFDITQQILDTLHEASTGELRDMFPGPIPPIQLAKPASKAVSGGTVYYYALPAESGLDKQIAPNAGVSESILAASLLPRFTARLLAGTPLAGSGPLAQTDRPLAGAFHISFSGFLEAVDPWIDYGLKLGLNAGANGPTGSPMGNIPQQVHDVVDVLQCFRGVSGVTYKEGNATVTHALWQFEDLQ